MLRLIAASIRTGIAFGWNTFVVYFVDNCNIVAFYWTANRGLLVHFYPPNFSVCDLVNYGLTTLMPFQIPSGLWKPALVWRLSQNQILFVGDVSLSNGKHSSTQCMTGFSQFNHCVVCVPDAKPNRGTHFVRRARIERTNIAPLQTPLPVHPRVPGVGWEREAKKPSSKCESYGAVFSWRALRLK